VESHFHSEALNEVEVALEMFADDAFERSKQEAYRRDPFARLILREEARAKSSFK
jgi:hypothetical protein